MSIGSLQPAKCYQTNRRDIYYNKSMNLRGTLAKETLSKLVNRVMEIKVVLNCQGEPGKKGPEL